jgi:hypothetical protein
MEAHRGLRHAHRFGGAREAAVFEHAQERAQLFGLHGRSPLQNHESISNRGRNLDDPLTGGYSQRVEMRCFMPKLLLAGCGVLLVGALAGSAAAQTSATQGWQKVDVSKLGPQVGERVPDFTLPDQTGQPRTLQSVMGPNGLMLVFYRSADW